MAQKRQEEDYEKSLAESFNRWEHLYKHGGQDPFYTDGVNLDLVRNHIIYYKRKIDETMTELMTFPAIYYRETPPEVDRNYMARPDEIREHAKASLAAYLADPEYQFLCRRIGMLNPKQAKEVHIVNVIGYATGLEKAIETDDLVTMRRHENADSDLEAFAWCAEKVRQLPPENVQMALGGNDYANDYGVDYDNDYDYDDDNGDDNGDDWDEEM
jgi:hypothetical protein